MSCAIAAADVVQADAARLAQWRSNPGMKLPGGALRHVDDQAVAALAAVLQAERRAGPDFVRDPCWGVVAAPRYFGRAGLIQAFRRYAVDGAWGIAPHLVPQMSQHAAAGVVSQWLGLRGPSLGVGGGDGGVLEGCRTAATLVQSENVPGVWLIATRWQPEPRYDDQGRPSSDAVCWAAALAVVSAPAVGAGPRLVVEADRVVFENLPTDIVDGLLGSAAAKRAA
ncbi:MAG: hypothetical protein NZO58_04030 [Gemmataceae bacterium]|nr:hypothetical protein [Gemmataceae bacterium]